MTATANLLEFQNPVSGREDNAAKMSTWWGFILGMLMLLATGSIALWIWAKLKLAAAGNATLSALTAKLGLAQSAAGTQPQAPQDPTGASALGFSPLG